MHPSLEIEGLAAARDKKNQGKKKERILSIHLFLECNCKCFMGNQTI
jgi:hypothetical protein